MKLFILKYGALIIIITNLSYFLWDGYKNLRTSGILVSEDYSTLTCSPDIRIIPSKNALDYQNRTISGNNTTVKNDICTLDQVFDGSKEDRYVLHSYSERVLDFWVYNRPDIAQYFYRKVIEENPNDDLSKEIIKNKITN